MLILALYPNLLNVSLSKIKRMNFYLDAFLVLPRVSWWLQVFGLC